MARLFHAFSLKLEFDYIPESNPPQIKVFLRESKEGKRIKASECIGRPRMGEGERML